MSDDIGSWEIRFTQLEIIALEVQPADAAQPYLLVIHVMPTQLRG